MSPIQSTITMVLRDSKAGDGGLKEQTITVDPEGICVVGTADIADVNLPRGKYTGLGRKEFRIANTPEGIIFEHLGFPHACSVNGAKTEECKLDLGTHRIEIDDYSFELQITG